MILRKPGPAALALAAAVCPAVAGAATLEVGPGQTYSKPCAAIAAAHAGDVIQVDASGDYTGDTCSWSTDALTVTGINGRARIDLAGAQPAGKKGIFTIEGTASATIENFELSGAAIAAADGNNGAGIRHQGLNLTVRNCFIHDNQDGILGAPATANTGTVLIENTELAANGAGDGFSHNIYIGNYAKFVLQYSYSHGAKVGHLVKSRAYSTSILYNRLTDEAGGTASYETDVPNAGTAYLIGNLIEQSATTQNPTIVSYGEEGVPAGYDSHLFLVNNTLLNTRGTGTFVADATTTPAQLTNNIFYNGGTITNQSSAIRVTNFDSSSGDPMFVDLATYDVNLAAGSPCVDHGSDPGTGGEQSLAPAFEYVHPLGEAPRSVVGAAIDIGAYERGDTGDASVSAMDGGTSSAADAAAIDDGGAGAADAASHIAHTALDAAQGGASDAGGAASSAHASGGCGCVVEGAPEGLSRCVFGSALLLSWAIRRKTKRRR